MRRALLLLPALALLLGAAPGTERLATERQALRDARAQKAAAEARVATLEERARDARGEAERSARALDTLRGQVAATEADITAATARLALVRGLQRERAARLGAGQQPVVELMAALEARRRRPAVLAILQPGSLDDLVHTRAVLATVTPAVQRRTAALRAELQEARALAATARTALATVRTARAQLADDQRRLAAAEAEARRTGRALAGAALSEGDRALALGERAFDIADRLGGLEEAQTTAARLSALPVPTPRPGSRSDPRAPDRPPAYRLPVTGELLAGLGEVAPTGVSAKGPSFRVTAGTLVRAPAAGRVAYAGPYGRYGRILILDHGGGWTTLLTGLGALGVTPGERVEPGRPLGRAAGDPLPLTVELRRGNDVIDMLAL